jgi:serine/threonine protein kinase
MNKLKHPKLVQLYGYYRDTENLVNIVIELCQEDLYKSMKKEYKYTMKQKFEIIIDIASGLQIFHSNDNPIVHRDIKPDNVLITNIIEGEDSNFSAKLADYGECYFIDDLKKLDFDDSIDCMTLYNGTIKYAPPEICLGDLRLLSIKSDIYSLGSLIWEIFTGERPFEEVNDTTSLGSDIIQYHLTPEIEKLPIETPEEIKNLILRCWSKESEDRPSIEDVIRELKSIQKNYKFINFHK